MKTAQHAKEWASVGAGAMISGALIVVVSQLAVVRQRAELPALEEVDAPSGAVAQESTTAPERPRLQLPPTAELAALQSSPEDARQLDPLQAADGKPALRDGQPVSSTAQRQADTRSSGKAIRSDVSPTLTVVSPEAETTRPPTTSIHPTYELRTGAVNAAFEAPDARTAGEEFSWDVHETFRHDGPRPFVQVDEATGTLMFGLGWQH